jgi:putative sterol carrier protein
MSLQSMTDAVRGAIGADCGLKKRLKFVFEEGAIHVDGTAVPNDVSNDGTKDADLTLTLALADFERIMAKQASGKKLMLLGKMKLRGDIRITAHLDRILKLT